MLCFQHALQANKIKTAAAAVVAEDVIHVSADEGNDIDAAAAGAAGSKKRTHEDNSQQGKVPGKKQKHNESGDDLIDAYISRVSTGVGIS